MASSNATLTSLWVDEGQASPMKVGPGTPTRNGGELISDELLKLYREQGLEPVIKEGGFVEANGDMASLASVQHPKPIQMYQMVQISSPVKSPFKLEHALLPKSATTANTITPTSPMILGTPHRVLSAAQVVAPASSPRGASIVTPVAIESPQHWNSGVRKRTHDFIEQDFSDGKRGKKGEKGGKGLRHFSMKVCEKVQKKGVTSYNEVADELVQEFSDPRNMTPSDQVTAAYDQKNIRRRVYDALNVLMAMNIISKEKKEIRWIGLPTNSAQECQNLEFEKQRRLDRIKHKTQQLQELILQQIAFKNLVQRNRQLEQSQGAPTSNSAIQLPFIIVNTSKKTVIDCSISNDKYEYLFNFDNTFEIHDDIEVLKRMGMAFGLEKNSCADQDLKKATKMVPKSLEPYVLELAGKMNPGRITAGSSRMLTDGLDIKYESVNQSPLAIPLATVMLDQSADAEVALATAQGLSRQSSIGSYSDLVPSRDSPSEGYSDESESERSSPVDING